MNNPLATATFAGSETLNPGDTRIVNVKDRSGAIIRTVTIHRTTRRYELDLLDAYNASLSRTDIEWALDDSGNLYLRDKANWTAAHTRSMDDRADRDRQEWQRRQRNPVSA